MEQELVSIPFGKSKIDGLYYNSTIHEEDNKNNDTALPHQGWIISSLDTRILFSQDIALVQA